MGNFDQSVAEIAAVMHGFDHFVIADRFEGCPLGPIAREEITALEVCVRLSDDIFENLPDFLRDTYSRLGRERRVRSLKGERPSALEGVVDLSERRFGKLKAGRSQRDIPAEPAVFVDLLAEVERLDVADGVLFGDVELSSRGKYVLEAGYRAKIPLQVGEDLLGDHVVGNSHWLLPRDPHPVDDPVDERIERGDEPRGGIERLLKPDQVDRFLVQRDSRHGFLPVL